MEGHANCCHSRSISVRARQDIQANIAKKKIIVLRSRAAMALNALLWAIRINVGALRALPVPGVKTTKMNAFLSPASTGNVSTRMEAIRVLVTSATPGKIAKANTYRAIRVRA